MVVGNTPTAREKNSLPEGRAPASANEQTEEPVEQIQLWARMTPLEHDELLTKCQIFEKETVTRPEETNQRSQTESKETEHGGDL